MPNVLIARLKAAWSVLVGRERIFVRTVEGAAEADLRQLHARLTYATQILKELPMALIDDINALGPVIDNALAAKDASAADTTAKLTAANATIDTLNGQIATADAAVVALTAKYAPPAPAPQPQIDPNTGLLITAQ